MVSDVDSRRQVARAAYIARRGDLGLTQEDVARLADVAVRTVVNWESQGVWPNAKTRARLEKAVQWEPGQLEQLAASVPEGISPETLERLGKLTRPQREWLVGWLLEHRPRGGGGNGSPRQSEA